MFWTWGGLSIPGGSGLALQRIFSVVWLYKWAVTIPPHPDSPGQRPRRRTPPGAGLSAEDVSRVIEMAWEDRTPFESIAVQFGLAEGAVIALMRRELQPGSFRAWRARVTGRATKHAALRPTDVTRAYCPTQYKP